MIKDIICRLFHFNHWEIYNTDYLGAPYRFADCRKCKEFHKIKLGKEVD